MKNAAFVLVTGIAIAAAIVLFVALRGGSEAPAEMLIIATLTPTPPVPATATPAPLAGTWLSLLARTHGGATAAPVLTSCLDRNRDLRLDAADGPAVPDVGVILIAGESCVAPALHADYYAGAPSDPEGFLCAALHAPLLIVAIPSAGSDLLATKEGESLGLIPIINALEAEADLRGVSHSLIIAASAIFGAQMPQTSMERWLTARVGQRMAELPCLRVVLIGHSHGGATVTSVTAALDDAYGDRMLGVLIDRTNVLYDRPAEEIPARTPLLNVYQTNEGWHGNPYGSPNIANIDESPERAPVAPSDGGGGLALVSHKTLDDATGVQQRIVAAVLLWLDGG